MRKLSRRNLVILGSFVAAFFTFAVVAAISFNTIRDFINGSRWVSHTQNTLVSMEELISLIKDADSNQRGYLVSDEEHYLDRYRKSVERIPSQLNQIKRLTSDNPSQQKNIEMLESLINARLALQQEVIQSRKNGAEQAELLALFSQGEAVQEQIGLKVATMRAEEYGLLAQRSAVFENVSVITNQVIISADLAALTVLGVTGWLLFGEVRRRTQAEQVTKHYLAEVEDLYNNAPCGYYSIDKDGVLVKVNDTWLNWAGYKREEVLCKSRLSDFMTPESAERFWSSFPQFKESGVLQDVEFEFISKAGKIIPLSVSATAVRDSEGKYLMSRSLAFDVSERKQAEQKLRQSNVFLNSLIENIPNMIFVKEVESLRFVRFNKAGEELLGYSREELIGKSDYDFFPKEEADFFTAKDRTVLEYKQLVDIAEEKIHTRHHGVRILHTMKIPIMDELEAPRYLLGISEDITASKEAEREIKRLNEDLTKHAAQLEVTNRELESFSYSVSHDLRAPLRAIDGFAKMLQEDYAGSLDEKGARWLAVIRNNSNRMGRLIDDLLAFSRLGRKPINTSRFDMTALVREVLAELEGDPVLNRCEIRVAPLGNAVGDRALIKQVWANVIGNSLKYSGTRSHPVIEIFQHQEKNDKIYGIRDNGVGFDMQYYGKLFGVFERLHAADEFTGTGVGLAIVQRIVVRHGGRVWAEGKVNEGATFYFTLGMGIDHAEC